MEQKPPFFRAIYDSLIRQRKSEKIDKVDALARSFSITEKVLFLLCLAIFSAGVLSILGKISDHFSVNVPRHGGSLVEGILGTPRFVNPLLSVSDADRDLSELVYSGLLKSLPDGTLAPDLAKSYTVSDDGLVYSFVIRDDAKFHDGTPVTADDVKFTIDKAEDPNLKSPRRVSFEGVTVEKTGTRSLAFHLKQPYAPFINNLTIGILPSHVWNSLTVDQIPFSSLNTNAIGSGPYLISSVVKSADGIPTEFVLKANPNYAGGEPYISTLYIKSFSSEKALVDALKQGTVESASNLSPASAAALKSDSSVTLLTAPLTRIFAVFFNQNQNEVLAKKEVRKALDLSVDKDSLIDSVLQGFGTAIDGPLPPTIEQKISADIVREAMTSTSSANIASSTTDAASKILTKAGWKKNPDTGIYELRTGKGKTAATTTLSLSISTANIPELVLAAKKLEESWKSFGVQVDVRVFEPSDLNQSVIRPRKYDALLFGLVTGKNGDLYPFWHSSQRNDPGLNIALYTNRKADQYLEKMRGATTSAALAASYAGFQAEIDNDTPAVFLWSPDFLYAIPNKLHGVDLGEITTSSDRFLGVEKWYVDIDHVWNVFVKDQNSIISK